MVTMSFDKAGDLYNVTHVTYLKGTKIFGPLPI